MSISISVWRQGNERERDDFKRIERTYKNINDVYKYWYS